MGKKHLLGLREGASENAVVVSALAGGSGGAGLSPRQRQSVSDSTDAKALRPRSNESSGAGSREKV